MDITPKTKISDILKAYPQLKEKIISLAPPFEKLRNPILLKTVAKVTSLSQAAKVGDIPVADLVNALRKEVGQEPLSIETMQHSADEPPFWFKTGTIVKTIDARPMLERGEHPAGIVLEEIRNVDEGEILELISSFVPAPLIDKVEEKNFHVWTLQKDSEEFRTFFSPK